MGLRVNSSRLVEIRGLKLGDVGDGPGEVSGRWQTEAGGISLWKLAEAARQRPAEVGG